MTLAPVYFSAPDSILRERPLTRAHLQIIRDGCFHAFGLAARKVEGAVGEGTEEALLEAGLRYAAGAGLELARECRRKMDEVVVPASALYTRFRGSDLARDPMFNNCSEVAMIKLYEQTEARGIDHRALEARTARAEALRSRPDEESDDEVEARASPPREAGPAPETHPVRHRGGKKPAHREWREEKERAAAAASAAAQASVDVEDEDPVSELRARIAQMTGRGLSRTGISHHPIEKDKRLPKPLRKKLKKQNEAYLQQRALRRWHVSKALDPAALALESAPLKPLRGDASLRDDS